MMVTKPIRLALQFLKQFRKNLLTGPSSFKLKRIQYFKCAHFLLIDKLKVQTLSVKLSIHTGLGRKLKSKVLCSNKDIDPCITGRLRNVHVDCYIHCVHAQHILGTWFVTTNLIEVTQGAVLINYVI